MRIFLSFSFCLFAACSNTNVDTDPQKEAENEQKQSLSATKDIQKVESTDPLEGCSQDLKDLDKWVKEMVEKRNKNEAPDMSAGQELVKKIQASAAQEALPENCQKILVEKIKSMSTESVDKANSIKDCQAKCNEIKIPPKRISCLEKCK